jgi:uncharacterized SAM-binding protein YcdF (DUF218 family)
VKKRSRTFRVTIVFLLLFFAWLFIAPYLAERLIIERPLERADAILILGGSSVYLERTRQAAAEYKRSVAAKIFLTDDGERSGWSRLEKRNIPYVELAQRNLIAEGVPAAHIEIIKPVGSGTIYEAQQFKERSAEENWQTVLLVTSAYHTRRTLWTFERVFEPENVQFGIVAAPPGEQTPAPNFWWLAPHGWSFVAGEYVKSFYYWVYY